MTLVMWIRQQIIPVALTAIVGIALVLFGTCTASAATTQSQPAGQATVDLYNSASGCTQGSTNPTDQPIIGHVSLTWYAANQFMRDPATGAIVRDNNGNPISIGKVTASVKIDATPGVYSFELARLDYTNDQITSCVAPGGEVTVKFPGDPQSQVKSTHTVCLRGWFTASEDVQYLQVIVSKAVDGNYYRIATTMPVGVTIFPLQNNP